MDNTVSFQWTEMNNETFKTIDRGSTFSEEILAVGHLGAILVGRAYKYKEGYALDCYLGGGFFNIVKFVKLDTLR